jgi:SM-20-related protein
MPRAEFFNHLGLFAIQDFFIAEQCLNLRAEMNSTTSRSGTIWRKGSASDVTDESVKRRTEMISDATLSLVKEQLLALMPKLACHFNLSLKGCEKGKLVVYREGDFYAPHLDSSDEPDAPKSLRERQLSVVIFLNSEADEPEPGSYCGGALTFYGIIDDPQWNVFGLPLIGEEGMLIAFRPNLIHEVKPVTYGERYTITNWFF